MIKCQRCAHGSRCLSAISNHGRWELEDTNSILMVSKPTELHNLAFFWQHECLVADRSCAINHELLGRARRSTASQCHVTVSRDGRGARPLRWVSDFFRPGYRLFQPDHWHCALLWRVGFRGIDSTVDRDLGEEHVTHTLSSYGIPERTRTKKKKRLFCHVVKIHSGRTQWALLSGWTTVTGSIVALSSPSFTTASLP